MSDNRTVMGEKVMEELRFRQIHMDFHTSEKIAETGERFNGEKFAGILKKAHVNSVTCFARCHHGMLYYDSKNFPELVHPGLKEKNLLERQIDACHKQGIKVPVYLTVQYDYHSSMNHPDWVCLNPEGGMIYRGFDRIQPQIYEPGFYRTLCVNTSYRDFLKAQVRDIFESIGTERVDGLFLDIVNVIDCSCQNCRNGMKKMGYHPDQYKERVLYAREMLMEFKREMTEYIHLFKKDLTVFYNGSHFNSVTVKGKDAYSHWELESLPSGKWGYSHFSNTVRFARTTGLDFLAHTGKFHTSWGDFHSFKNKEALEYECFRMLAYNSKCLIGDQLDPDGAVSEPVYELIGGVYEQVEKKEPWCSHAKELVDIGVLTSEYYRMTSDSVKQVPKEVNGACTMLDELGYQFNIIDEESDFSQYRVIILPDVIPCGTNLADKLEKYTECGGKILATGKSGLNEEGTRFKLTCLGVVYKGEAPYSPDFILPNEIIGRNLPKTEHVMYNQGERVEIVHGKEVAQTCVPYFNRTWEHFCSHLHTPSTHQYGYPAVVENDGHFYFIHPVFTIYQEKHPKWCKEIISDALQSMIEKPLLKHNGPSTMIATLNEQISQNRYILHALHYIPVKVSEELLTIEDVIPLYQIRFILHVKEPVISVRVVPDGTAIPFCLENGELSFVIPEINGHCMIEMAYRTGKEKEEYI